MNETWCLIIGTHVEMPDRMRKFLEEIDEVSRKHGLSISHEDGHGAFIVEEYDESNIDWLFEAYKGYMEEDEI